MSNIAKATWTEAHVIDAKSEEKKVRTRHILANSGKIMESGEIRPVDQLYVMGRDAKLIKIASLNKDPKKQTEKYDVKAQADHGEYDAVSGELIPTIEKCFGDCRVWLEDDGLHALMRFANNDPLADHCYAISDEASYSTGIDIYKDGYYGGENEIDGPVAILREISMVLTGNDPRAMTIDQKPSTAEAQRGAVEGYGKNNRKEKVEMPEPKKDNLTPDESVALKEKVMQVIDDFTTKAPEAETEPTEDTKDEAAEAPETKAEAEEKAEEPVAKEQKEEPKEEEKDILHMPVVAVKDSAVKQEFKETDALSNKNKVVDALKASKGRFDARFNDGITGLADPCGVAKAFDDALEKSKGLISHFTHINAKQFTQNLVNGTGDASRAGGHKKGDTKSDQVLTNATRDILVKMVYKKLDFDALEVYENPEIINFRAKELVNGIISEIERAAISGDGRSAGTPDRRMYDGTRGFRSIAKDAADKASDAFSGLVVDTYEKPTTESFYQAVQEGVGKLDAEGAVILVTKKANITALKKAQKTDGSPMLNGATPAEYLGVDYIYTPRWMDDDETYEAYLFVDGCYAWIGESEIQSRPDFDVNTNKDVLLDETPRGGALIKAHSGVAISFAPGK